MAPLDIRNIFRAQGINGLTILNGQSGLYLANKFFVVKGAQASPIAFKSKSTNCSVLTGPVLYAWDATTNRWEKCRIGLIDQDGLVSFGTQNFGDSEKAEPSKIDAFQKVNLFYNVDPAAPIVQLGYFMESLSALVNFIIASELAGIPNDGYANCQSTLDMYQVLMNKIASLAGANANRYVPSNEILTTYVNAIDSMSLETHSWKEGTTYSRTPCITVGDHFEEVVFIEKIIMSLPVLTAQSPNKSMIAQYINCSYQQCVCRSGIAIKHALTQKTFTDIKNKTGDPMLKPADVSIEDCGFSVAGNMVVTIDDCKVVTTKNGTWKPSPTIIVNQDGTRAYFTKSEAKAMKGRYGGWIVGSPDITIMYGGNCTPCIKFMVSAVQLEQKAANDYVESDIACMMQSIMPVQTMVPTDVLGPQPEEEIVN